MLVRNVGQLHPQDSQNLQQFAEQYSLSLFVMTAENAIVQLNGEAPYYQIHGIKLGFSIRDFIQVNGNLNEKMVDKALEWLNLSAQDRVLDLFCGMGNFTLPIAKQAGFVVGVEGVQPMVEQAKQNQATSGLKT